MIENKKRNRPCAVLLDFYGTVVEEDEIPIASICDQIVEAATTQTTPGEIGEYWGKEFFRLYSESYGPTFRNQKELEFLSLQRVLDHYQAA